MDKNKIDIANWTLQQALSAGAQAARIELSCIDNIAIQCQDIEVSTLQQSRGCGLVMRLFVDGRYGTYSTNRLERADLLQLINNGIACTRLLSPDPDRSLPDPARYYRASDLEANRKEALALGNFSATPPQADPIELAIETARPVMGSDPRLIHLSTYLSYRSGWQYMADSQDFHGYSCCSTAAAYCTASLQDEGDSRPSDSWMEYAISIDELRPLLADLGLKALEAARQRLGATPVPAGRYNIAVEQTCLMRLLGPILSAMQDSDLYTHRSFLASHHIGDIITSPLLSLSDQPQRHRAFSACLFDFEGVRTEHTTLIREGHLCEWFIGTYLGRKMQLTPHLSGPNVLCIEPGSLSRQEVLDQLDDTILITGFLGGNCNDVTGDFSFGIEGQLYRRGERIKGVAGVNLTGNMLDFWQNLSHVCNDVEKLPDGYFPTLFFHDIKIA